VAGAIDAARLAHRQYEEGAHGKVTDGEDAPKASEPGEVEVQRHDRGEQDRENEPLAHDGSSAARR
jgi:hypothetical protein